MAEFGGMSADSVPRVHISHGYADRFGIDCVARMPFSPSAASKRGVERDQMSTEPTKREYHAPALQVLGSMREITAALPSGLDPDSGAYPNDLVNS